MADWKHLFGRVGGGSGVCPAFLLAAGPWGAEPGGVGRGPRRFQARGTLRLSAWDSGTRNRGGGAWRGPAQPGGEGSRLEGNGHRERSPSAALGRARRPTQCQTGTAHYVTLSRGPRLPALVLRKTGRCEPATGALLNFVSSRAWISVSDNLVCLSVYWGNLCVSGQMRTPLGCE